MYFGSLLNELQLLERDMKCELAEIFPADTVDEWVSVLLTPRIEDVTEILNTTKKHIVMGATPKASKTMELDDS